MIAKLRNPLLLLVTVAGSLILFSGIALAAAQSALWHMEDPTKLVDSSGNGNNGTTKNITSTTGFANKGYHFNGSSSMATVPSSDSLNPELANIQITTHLRFTKPPSKAVGDYDVIRKGLSNSPGGDYKIEVLPRNNHKKAKAFCLFKGSSGKVGKIVDGPNLADGRWHTVSCTKTATSVQLTVDGQTFTNQVVVGLISNTQPLTIGAKSGGGDWYSGDMDEVSIGTF